MSFGTPNDTLIDTQTIQVTTKGCQGAPNNVFVFALDKIIRDVSIYWKILISENSGNISENIAILAIYRIASLPAYFCHIHR